MILNKKYKIIFSIILTLILGLGFLFAYIGGVFTPLIEKIINESPEAKISAYLRAVSKEDKETALNIWHYSALSPENDDRILLKERREKITDDFIKAKINPEFKIINIEWWTTCCIPSITDNSRGAGRAIVKAELFVNNEKKVYVFDVYVKDGNYAGEAAGYPVRHWEIGDVYLLSDRPLLWLLDK